MSSVAMYLQPTNTFVDPGYLNNWLRNNGGYSGNLFVWGSVEKTYKVTYKGKVTRTADIDSHINQGHGVILNVNNGGHWVLATGISGSNYLVNDPGYSKTSYGKGEVKEAAVYTRGARLEGETPMDADYVDFISE